MAKIKEKACKICKFIYLEENVCPKCGAKEFTDSFKGRIFVANAEKSEIAKNINIAENGLYAVKTR